MVTKIIAQCMTDYITFCYNNNIHQTIINCHVIYEGENRGLTFLLTGMYRLNLYMTSANLRQYFCVEKAAESHR